MGHIKNERCGESCHKYYTWKYVKLQGGKRMIYITGDTHVDFRNVERFCKKNADQQRRCSDYSG